MDAAGALLILTEQLKEDYIKFLKKEGRKLQTICLYSRCMNELYDFLPEGKEIMSDTLVVWKRQLIDCGYSKSTINVRMTAANGLLRFCGMEEYTIAHEHIFRGDEMPELSRAEYLQFLFTVRMLGEEQEYLLIRLFASVDIRIQELPYLTVESCHLGMLNMPDGRQSILPPSLGQEILNYAKEQNITSGAIFVTRNGNPLDRSNVSRSIRELAREAGIDPEKCCPRALHRIYRTTQEELKARILPIYLQTYDNLLKNEQTLVGWQKESKWEI